MKSWPYVDIAAVVCAVIAIVVIMACDHSDDAEPATVGAPGYESELEACARLASHYDAEAEVVLKDKSRVDLLSDKYAIEVDWAREKWKEAVGQSLWYSIRTNREPAIILLRTGPGDDSHITRCRHVCGRAGITLFVEEARRK